jgi:hypothetical protein
MGCTSCGKKGGCDTRKAGERELLAELLPRLYPGRRWGEPDDEAWQGVGEREGRRLAQHAAELCKAPSYFRLGADDEVCDHVWVLCVGRQPGLVTLLDEERAEMLDGEVGDAIEERYLRLSLSRLARVAALQEVVLRAERDGDVWQLEERPRSGVYDPILLKRTQRLVELVVDHDIAYLDFGLVAKPPDAYAGDGWDGAAWAARFGGAPATVNYLFYAQPATEVRTVFLAAGDA